MSKKSKSAAKERRKAAKRGRKAAQRARYERYRVEGKNTKSKRSQLRTKRKKLVRTHRHATACGNVGCDECTPTDYSLKAVKQRFGPNPIPRWVWLKMQRVRKAA